MKKRICRFLPYLMLLCMLCPLAGAESKEDTTVFTQEMIDRSLTAVGNTERLHRAIDKARSGENVTIAYLGGSITEGALAKPQATKCYAAVSAQLFAEKFMQDKSQLTYVNAGISGTPSLLGLTRLEQDVLSKKPDIVFVEFAVNDSTDVGSRIVYESMVRKLLNSETQPAVILIFTLMDSGYSAQEHMQQIGSHYALGMVSVRDAVQPQIDVGKMTWRDYSSDYAHPTTEGHAFIAELIGNYFDQAEKTAPAPYAVTDKYVFGKSWEGLVNILNGDPAIVSQGSFPFGAASCYSYRTGWVHAAGTEPLVMKVTGDRMTFAFKQEKTTACGTAEVWVDGKMTLKLPGYGPNAWGNVVTEKLMLGSRGEHTVELRMAEGDEGKRFTLLGVGLVP